MSDPKKIILYGSIVGFVMAGIFIPITSKAGVNAIIEHEGFSATAYQDITGNWTIGYGHLIKANEQYLMEKTLTKAEAEAILANDLRDAEIAVGELVKVPLNANQHDALVSFVFNVGRGNFANSTLLKKLNAGDYEGAANEFERWVYSKGVKVAALEKRRAAEKNYFLA